MASIFPKVFQKILKNTKIRILYPKKYDEHTYHFTMEVKNQRQNSDDYANLWSVIDLTEQLIYLVTYLIDLLDCH